MKQILIPLSLIVSILVLLAIIFVGLSELNDRNRVQQSTIDGLRRANKAQADSLVSVIKLKDDTLTIAKNTIIHQFYTIENERTEKENYKRNTHEKIRFINFTHDAGRDSVLSKLYITYRNLR